jgi:ABC-type uncharacterized transport system involved in gliding motility auxiliary subunit
VTRAGRNWTQLALQTGLLVVALGLFQTIAERTNRRFDLTPSRAMSLSPVTKKLLREVDAPLRITVFFRRGTREQYVELLESFRTENPNVQFELFDLDRFPERGRSFGVVQYGRAVVEYGERRAVALAAPEEQLAGGILRVLRGRARRMLFTTGHGERTPGGAPESYGRLASALATENYAPEGFGLLDGRIPEDTDLVVVAGPKSDFVPVELDALAAYLKRGGGVLMLLDPASLPNVGRFLASLGIVLGDDFIVDRERKVLNTEGLAAVVELFKRGNPVTDAVTNPIESGVVLPSARSVDVTSEVSGVQAESVARTSPTAWAVADPARARRGEEPSKAHGDTPGSAPVVVVAEVGAAENGAHRSGRLVVVGDADFASDAYLDLLGNRDLALNAVAWLAEEEALAGTRTKRVPEIIRPLSPLVLREPEARMIFLFCVVALPAVVFAGGAGFVLARRRRG